MKTAPNIVQVIDEYAKEKEGLDSWRTIKEQEINPTNSFMIEGSLGSDVSQIDPNTNSKLEISF
jgi:hypothetical protein